MNECGPKCGSIPHPLEGTKRRRRRNGIFLRHLPLAIVLFSSIHSYAFSSHKSNWGMKQKPKWIDLNE
jgi:hypothetical protein